MRSEENIQSFGPQLGLLCVASPSSGGRRLSADFLDPPHGHAHVGARDVDKNPCGFCGGLDSVCYLSGESFLDLEAFREDVYDTGNFAEADDGARGNVGDVTDAMKRKQMVFA